MRSLLLVWFSVGLLPLALSASTATPAPVGPQATIEALETQVAALQTQTSVDATIAALTTQVAGLQTPTPPPPPLSQTTAAASPSLPAATPIPEGRRELEPEDPLWGQGWALLMVMVMVTLVIALFSNNPNFLLPVAGVAIVIFLITVMMQLFGVFPWDPWWNHV